jgi:hypothetical protein
MNKTQLLAALATKYTIVGTPEEQPAQAFDQVTVYRVLVADAVGDVASVGTVTFFVRFEGNVGGTETAYWANSEPKVAGSFGAMVAQKITQAFGAQSGNGAVILGGNLKAVFDVVIDEPNSRGRATVVIDTSGTVTAKSVLLTLSAGNLVATEITG